MVSKEYKYDGMKHMGKIEKYIYDKLSEHPLLFAVIDPADYKSLDDAVATGISAYEGGVDAILVSGSTEVTESVLDNVCSRMKKKIDVPVLIFPGNINMISKYADAIYFMSLLNSRNPYWITRSQMIASPVVKRLGIEPLPVAYTVVEPGGTVGWVADVDLIPRSKPRIAAAMGMAAEYMGFHFFINDSGSAPKDGHIPLNMVKIVSSAIHIPYIVAGGIRTPEEARNVVQSGADIIQVGTALEKNGSKDLVKEFVDAVHNVGK